MNLQQRFSRIGRTSAPLDALPVAPDFSQVRLVNDGDYGLAVADTLPPEHLGAEQLLEGCNVISAIRQQFELKAEARKLLMVIALVRWMRAFENKGFYHQFGCRTMNEFVEKGHVRSPDGRPLVLRSWQHYRRLVELFDELHQHVLELEDNVQDVALRKLLEVGPSKLALLYPLIESRGSAFVLDAMTGHPHAGLTLAGEPIDLHVCSVSQLKAYLESLKERPLESEDALAPVHRLKQWIESVALEARDPSQRQALRDSLAELRSRIDILLETLN